MTTESNRLSVPPQGAAIPTYPEVEKKTNRYDGLS